MRRTTTCTSRCSSARSRRTASSTSCGRPRARSRPSPGARSSKATTRRRTSPRRSDRGGPTSQRGPAPPHPGAGSLWMTSMRPLVFALALTWSALASAALPPDVVLKLGTGDGDERTEAVHALAATQDPAARALIEAVLAGQVQASEAAKKVLVVVDGKATDAATGAAIATIPPDAEDVIVNNRLRRALETALAAFALASNDRSAREKALAALEKDPQSVDAGM